MDEQRFVVGGKFFSPLTEAIIVECAQRADMAQVEELVNKFAVESDEKVRATVILSAVFFLIPLLAEVSGLYKKPEEPKPPERIM